MLVTVLLVLYRSTGAAMARRPAVWPAVWFAIGLGFVGFLYPAYEHGWFGAELSEPSTRPGFDASTMFVCAYLLEYALGFDTAFVAADLCRRHRIPPKHQPRVHLWALIGAIPFRVAIMSGGVWLARASTWTHYVFGALVAYQAIKMLTSEDEEEPRTGVEKMSRMPVARVLWRFTRLRQEADTAAFWTAERGRTVVTMVGACTISFALADAIFALDTALTVVAVSKTAFIVIASNVLATIALRGWFSMIGTVDKLVPPRFAIAALLGVISIKLVAQNYVHVPLVVVLAVITALVGGAVAETVIATRRARRV